MKILMIIVIFFLIGAFFIISENNLHLSKQAELREFKLKYFNWLDNVFMNFKQVSGYVVKLDWLPDSG